MSDEIPRTPADEPQPPMPSGKAPQDIADEIREMGLQFEAMFRAALESERAKQLRRDLAGGMQELSGQIQTALKTLQTSPMAQQAEERGRQLLEQAQQSKLVQDLQETVVSGVAQLNDRLRQLVAQLEQERAAPIPSTLAQKVPIETEPPVFDAPAVADDLPLSDELPPMIGETRRLDDEA